MKKTENKPDTSHVRFRNENLFCYNCGQKHILDMPMPISDLTKKIDAFNILHENCKKTWSEPVADMTKSVKERADWWKENGSVGSSSLTIYNFMSGNSGYKINIPYDPDDFSRCHALLLAIPEWRPRLHEMKSLSRQWFNLVEKWDTLTGMYEANVATDWKNHEKIGMYELMQSLIK